MGRWLHCFSLVSVLWWKKNTYHLKCQHTVSFISSAVIYLAVQKSPGFSHTSYPTTSSIICSLLLSSACGPTFICAFVCIDNWDLRLHAGCVPRVPSSSLGQHHLPHWPRVLYFYVCSNIWSLLTLWNITPGQTVLGGVARVPRCHNTARTLSLLSRRLCHRGGASLQRHPSPCLSSKRLILHWSHHFCRKLLLFKKNDFINYGKQLMKAPMFRAITEP